MMMKSIRHTRAFTLIEMVVVIGIIALLAALTLGISNSVIRNSEVGQTTDALKLLEMALQEWELEKGRQITFDGYIPIQNGVYDVYAMDENIAAPSGFTGVDNEDMLESMEHRIEHLIEVLLQSEPAKEILAKISPDLFTEDEHGKLVVDPWGTPIGVVFPGRDFVDAYPNDDPSSEYAYKDESNDLTVRDQAEDGLGSCLNLRPYFVSAGPDRLWGYLYQAANGFGDETLRESVRDNIYSYEPFIVEEAR